jgi:two-component system heavy metal sensor histidine kinase CusS
MPVYQFAILPDGRSGRQITFRFEVTLEEDEPPTKPQYAYISLARDTGSYDHIMARLEVLLTLVAIVGITAMMLLTALVIRRGLLPVGRLAADIKQISVRNLSNRLSAEQAPAELSPIVSGLNGLLDRLKSAFDREKSFTADAAHELRTPLAGLESALEVCARKERAPEAYASVVSECLEVARRMHSMIDNLLLLARADADRIRAAASPVDLEDVLEESWLRFSRSATQRGLDIQWDVRPGLIVQTDRDKLLHVFCNVFENAVRYADQNGRIRVSAGRADESAIVRIANSGSKISAEDAGHVFERFWRGDPARAEIGTHCGLGLSVCRNMMSVLRGSIQAKSQAGGEFEVEISLPISVQAPQPVVAVSPASLLAVFSSDYHEQTCG